MADKSLHSAVDQLLKGRGESRGKGMLGYTVSSYKNVLDDLEKSLFKLEYTNTGAQAGLGAGGFSTANGLVITNGFTSTSTGVDMYQGQCAIEQYMSFVVKDSENNNLHVAVERPSKTDTSGMVSGITLTNTNPLFPAAGCNKDHIDKCKLGLGSETTPFYVGIAVDLAGFGVKFFQRYFNADGVQWDLSKLRTLAAKKALMAEVFIPQTGTNYITMHAPVSIDAPPPSGNSDSPTVMFKVWIPLPVLMTSNFGSIGGVSINNVSGGGKQKVGQGCNFVGSSFDENKGEISGFTPNAYAAVDFSKQCIFQKSGISENKSPGFVRLYLDKSKQADVEQIMGKFPDGTKFTTDIWKGQSSRGGENVSISIGSGDYSLDSETYFPPELGEVITKEKYLKALAIIRCAEVGTYKTTGAGNAEWNVAGDGAGITYGNYQQVGKTGGLTRLIEMYVNDPKSKPEYVQAINEYKGHAKLHGRGRCPEGAAKLMEALRAAGNGDPNMGYIQSKQVYTEQIQGKNFIPAFKRSGAKSALAFCIALHCYNQGRPNNFWSGVSATSDEATKCILMVQNELVFLRKMRWWPNPATERTSNHVRWTNDYIKAARNQNFDLSQTQRWCNATF